MAQNKVGGIIYLKVNGNARRIKGDFTYNPGFPKREEVIGADGAIYFKETPQPAFIEGGGIMAGDEDLESEFTDEGVTVSLELPNGATFVLSDAWWAGEGTMQTEEGGVSLRWVSNKGRLVPA